MSPADLKNLRDIYLVMSISKDTNQVTIHTVTFSEDECSKVRYKHKGSWSLNTQIDMSKLNSEPGDE